MTLDSFPDWLEDHPELKGMPEDELIDLYNEEQSNHYEPVR